MRQCNLLYKTGNSVLKCSFNMSYIVRCIKYSFLPYSLHSFCLSNITIVILMSITSFMNTVEVHLIVLLYFVITAIIICMHPACNIILTKVCAASEFPCIQKILIHLLISSKQRGNFEGFSVTFQFCCCDLHDNGIGTSY